VDADAEARWARQVSALCSLPALVWSEQQFGSAQTIFFLLALPRKFLAVIDGRVEFSLLGLLRFTSAKLHVQK